MRRFILSLLLCLVWSQAAWAATLGNLTVNPYVDIAPSPYGSTFNTWLDTVYNEINAGTFVNMESGSLSPTTDSLPMESVVYPYPGYESGKAVAFMFWLPGVTSQVPGLQARLIGSDSLGDFYMGSIDGQPYAINDPTDPNFGWGGIDLNFRSNGAIATILAAWGEYPDDGQDYWRGELRLASDPNQTVGLTSHIVPAPAAVWSGMVLLGMMGVSKLRQRKSTRSQQAA